MNPVHQKDSIPRLLLLIILVLGLPGTGVELLLLVWCLTNTLMKMRGHFGCRQGAMTSSGVHHARKSNAADGQKDPQIHKRICETPH